MVPLPEIKRVLIITYYWPPSGGGGVQRWLKFAKYLPEYGWQPVIFTPETQNAPATDITLESDITPDLEIIRRPIWEPYSIYRQITGRKADENPGAAFASGKKDNPLTEDISNWIRSNFFIPDARKFWIKPSVRFLKKYIPENRFDAVVTTGPPHSMHLIGLGLKKALNIQWLADFRDPWTDIDYFDQLKLTSLANRKHHRQESEVLKTADRVVCVSNSNSIVLGRKSGVKVEIITNGFDESDIPKGKITADEKFTISHIGTFMANRNPESLWQALSELIGENESFKADFKLVLVGKTDASITSELEKYGLNPFTEILPQVSHQEAILRQRQSQLLLITVNKTGDSKGMVTGKVFEYLASGRPILAIGPADGDLAEILKETGTGVISDFDDKISMKAHVMNFYKQYQQGTLSVTPRNVEKFTRKILAGDMAKLLNNITQ